MAHLRRIAATIRVFDDARGETRDVTADPDALAQRGLVHVEGSVYDCCRRRNHAQDGSIHTGDLRRGRATLCRHARANLAPPVARFAGE